MLTTERILFIISFNIIFSTTATTLFENCKWESVNCPEIAQETSGSFNLFVEPKATYRNKRYLQKHSDPRRQWYANGSSGCGSLGMYRASRNSSD